MTDLYTLEHDSTYAFTAADGVPDGEAHTTEDLAEEKFSSTSDQTTHTGNNSTTSAVSSTLKHILTRLDSLLAVLMTCKARECTHPWEVLHPQGNVLTLQDALDAEYDEFYEVQQERVHFIKCERGYIYESEGPHGVKAYSIDY